MKNKELHQNNFRLGNLIYQTTFCATTNEIQKHIKEVDVSDLYYSCEPVLITEEWLLKFGFKKDRDGSCIKNDIAIFLDKRFKTNLFLQENQDMFKWFGYECKIKYIHQLQNLYFVLTGDELIIKE